MEEARKQLLAKIVDRVFVYDQQVIAVALHGDFGVILDEDLSIFTFGNGLSPLFHSVFFGFFIFLLPSCHHLLDCNDTSACMKGRQLMTRALVLTNHKGGVSKSTSATNIAYGLVQILRSASVANSRALLVDTDSQGHATLGTAESKNYVTHDSLYTVLAADCKDAPSVLTEVIKPNNWDDDLDVLPASPCPKAPNANLSVWRVRLIVWLTP